MGEENIIYCKGKNEKSVTIDFIKSEFAQYMMVDNLNFLIGAGCSYNSSEDEENIGIPNMKQLYVDFFSKYPDFEVGGVRLFGMFDSNLEKLLEVMGAVKVTNQLINIDDKINCKLHTVQEYIRKAIEIGTENDQIEELYRRFYVRTVRKRSNSPINVFTTNYDLYNEKALDTLGFPYNNGFVGTYNRRFNPVSYKYAYVDNMNLSKDVWERVPCFYNLYKLHGSISWVKRGEEIYETDYKYIDSGETVMIYPTPLKDRSTLMTPYSDLFRNMESALQKKNSVLVMLGYSFNDDHINRIILNMLAIPSFRIVIFGDSASINKLKSLDDDRIVIINSEEKIHYFDRFVEEVMPDVQEDIKDEMDISSRMAKTIQCEQGEIDEQ